MKPLDIAIRHRGKFVLCHTKMKHKLKFAYLSAVTLLNSRRNMRLERLLESRLDIFSDRDNFQFQL
jgi:hypothetical protein